MPSADRQEQDVRAPGPLRAPTRSINDGSATVPFNTTLVFTAGLDPEAPATPRCSSRTRARASRSTAARTRTSRSIFTSYADDSVGGDTNSDGAEHRTPPRRRLGRHRLPQLRRHLERRTAPVPGRRHRPEDWRLRAKLGVSGADETLSSINHANIRYAGGAVPQTIGFRYDAITNFNSRPSITNVMISQTGGRSSAQAAISGDVDSFREDDLARGLLVRRATLPEQQHQRHLHPRRAQRRGRADRRRRPPRQPAAAGGARTTPSSPRCPTCCVSRLVIGQSLQSGHQRR